MGIPTKAAFNAMASRMSIASDDILSEFTVPYISKSL